MKRYAKLIIALMILVSSASAQTFTQRGTFEFGGDMTFADQTEQDSPSNSSTLSPLPQTMFSFNPYIGYMAAPGLELGITPGIATETEAGVTSTAFNLYFSPAYNINTHGNAYPYIAFLIGYNSQSANSTDGSGTLTTNSGSGIGGEAGIKVAIKGCGLVLFKIQYLHQEFKGLPFDYTGSNYYPLPVPTSYSLNIITFGIGFRLFSSPVVKGEKAK